MPESGGIHRTLIQPLLSELVRPNFALSATERRLLALEENLKAVYRYLQQQQRALDFGYDIAVQRINELPEMVLLNFWQDNVPANQTDASLSSPSTRGYVMPEEGSIVALGVRSNAARTAGSLTVEPTTNATATGFTVSLDGTNTTSNTNLQDQGLDTFARGDIISCIIDSASWAPTTADIDVTVAVVINRGVR